MEVPMQAQIMGYDRTSATFSPEGHLLQVEYAEKTVRLGSASIGLICKDGVVVVADKRVKDKLVQPVFSAKIYEIDSHIAATAAGILSDARVLIERGQLVAQQHRFMYDTPIDTESVMREIANIKQIYSQYGGARPFGVSVLLVGVDPSDEPKCFASDVTGNYLGYKATAIGENDVKIRDMLRKEYKEKVSIENNLRLALKIFKRVLGREFDIHRFEAAYVKLPKKEFTRLSGEELKKYLK